MPKGSGGFSSSGHRSSSHRSSSHHRSSSFRAGGRGISLIARYFIQTTPVGTVHTLVLVGGVVYTGTYIGVADGGIIQLTGVAGFPPGSTLSIGPNALIAFA